MNIKCGIWEGKGALIRGSENAEKSVTYYFTGFHELRFEALFILNAFSNAVKCKIPFHFT